MSDAEDITTADVDDVPVETTTAADDPESRWENAFATTANPDEIPDDANPELLRITAEEMTWLKVMSWGDGVHRETCEACGTEMVFERHPADWDWHPTGVRVRIECPKCGHMQYTEGVTEVEYVEMLNASLMAQVREETAKRLMAANDGKPVSIQDIRSGDSGSSAERSSAG